MLERTVANLAVLVAVHLGVHAAQRLQLIEHFPSAPHFLHRVRTQEVEIDLIQFMRVFAVVAFRPFLRVTDGTYGTQVRAGYEITLRVVLNEIGERQFGGVRMVGMTTHDETERTDLRRPQQVTVARRLRAALGHTLMDRTEFVHVVRLVGSRTRVEEREHTRDEERRFMVGHGVRSCEDRASLSVHTLAVREEKALARRVVFVENRALTYEALVHEGGVTDLYARSEDEIDTLHAAAEANRSELVGVDRSVLETTHAAQLGIVADLDVLDASAVQDTYVLADVTVVGSLCLGVRINLALEFRNHLRTMAIERQDIREAGRELVEDRYLTTTAFVHHRNTHTVTERRFAVHEDSVHILDAGLRADGVVGDVVVDVI